MNIDISKIGKTLGYFTGFVLLTVLFHWITVNVYVAYCAPFTLFGIFHTMIAMGSPMCHFLNTAQSELTKHYITLWSAAAIAMATWLTATGFGNNTSKNKLHNDKNFKTEMGDE
jgi:hypothetical protein|tara:strand:- start:128 stop:469 length:342 start_codon:yes stop_codon:yes gene_type:complete